MNNYVTKHVHSSILFLHNCNETEYDNYAAQKKRNDFLRYKRKIGLDRYLAI